MPDPLQHKAIRDYRKKQHALRRFIQQQNEMRKKQATRVALQQAKLRAMKQAILRQKETRKRHAGNIA